MADDKTESEIEASEDENEEALIPRSWFQGKDIEIGDTCKLKVEGIFDDEISVSYVKHNKKKDGKDKDSDDDDDDSDKPKRRRDRHWREGEMMDAAMSQMDGMGPPPPAMGGY